MTNEKELEQLSEEIHKLYCTQYEKDHGTPYWTNGDYSKLEERVKEYDRNIARWYLSKLHSHTKEVVEKIRGMKKENYTNKDIEDQLRIFTVTPVSDVAIKEFARTINNVSSKLGYNSALDDLLASLEDNKK